jgi:hypothetical protein
LKSFRLLFVILTAAVFSAAAWANGIDPRVIIQGGTGSTPITLTNPNPSVTSTAVANNAQNNFPCFFEDSAACVQDVFQNQTITTIMSLDVFIPTVLVNEEALVFTCGPFADVLFFDHCTNTIVTGGTHVFFSADDMNGFNGVPPAVLTCVPDSDDAEGSCDKDDQKFVGGEFTIDIEGSDLPAGTQITAQAITSPEPGTGLMFLFGVLAFGMFKLVRRAV